MEDDINFKTTDNFDKITNIKNLARSFELRLLGYEWDDAGQKFRYNGNVLCGTETAKILVGLIQPFSESISLIGELDRLTYEKRFYNLMRTVNSKLIKQEDCPTENYEVIWEMFKNTLDNITDVTIKSKSFIGKIFNPEKEEKESDVGTF